jgi:hypothetical protein
LILSSVAPKLPGLSRASNWTIARISGEIVADAMHSSIAFFGMPVFA